MFRKLTRLSPAFIKPAISPWKAHSIHPFTRCLSNDIESLKHQTDSSDSDNSVSNTGVLDYEKHLEVLIYFDHIYPLRVSYAVFRQYLRLMLPWQSRLSDEELQARVCDIASNDKNPLSEQISIREFVPLKRDGGAFVTFSVPPNTTPKELINQIVTNLRANEAEENKDYFKWFRNKVLNTFPTAYQVKGTPWIEDLSRYPSPRLTVKFEGDPLTEEELYMLFRRYGRIVDIVPRTSSDPNAIILFKNIRSAICAKNCITGITLDDGRTVLHLQYLKMQRVNFVKDLIVNHQRISIPIILALLATVAVFIFDPIRQWFIEVKIAHKYSFDTYKDNIIVKVLYLPYSYVVGWFKDSFDYFDEHINLSYFSKPSTEDLDCNANILWSERFEKVKQLKLWIYENVNTYIIVRGPKGSGKEEFVLDNTLQDDPELKKKVLYVDCEALSKARSDSTLIKNTANQLGYFPVFTWTNTISLFIDLGVQGLTGQKSGLSESKETQLKNMFLLTTQALRNVAMSDYQAYKKEVAKRQRKRTLEEESVIKEEVVREEDYLQQHPEVKPIVVINKFLKKSDGPNDFVYKMIAEWTAQLILSNLAHVIYITHDVASILHLNESLPNQVFKTIALSDASSKSARQYVINELSNKEKENEIDGCLDPLGGRMLDLQSFVRRIRSGETPLAALEEMVNQAAEQITTFFLNNPSPLGDYNWNTAQIWAIMRHLSTNDSIEFSELTKSPLFKASVETLATLAALEKNDLISLKRDKGILSTITVGRPLYKAAFTELVEDPKIFKLYETEYYSNLIAEENKKIAKLEDEIAKIAQLRDIQLLKERLDYVSNKINSCTATIKKHEENIKAVASMGASEKKSFLGIF